MTSNDWSDYFNTTVNREAHFYKTWVWDFRRQFKKTLDDERWRFAAKLAAIEG